MLFLLYFKLLLRKHIQKYTQRYLCSLLLLNEIQSYLQKFRQKPYLTFKTFYAKKKQNSRFRPTSEVLDFKSQENKKIIIPKLNKTIATIMLNKYLCKSLLFLQNDLKPLIFKENMEILP